MNIKDKLGLTEDVRIGTTASSPFLGSPTFDEVPFHVDSGRLPILYNYVIVERDRPESVHYGRIKSGTEENSRADPTRLQQNQAYQVGQRDPRPGDRSPHVTRVMTVEVLGELQLKDDEEIEFKEPSLLPQTGQGVYVLPTHLIPWLLGLPPSPDDGFHIGFVRSGNGVAEIALPHEVIPRQIAVCGKTGVGKSYFAGVLVEESCRHGIPVVSFDILGDLIHATEDLKGQNFRAGENFKVPYSVIGLTEFLNFIPNLTRDQTELVALAYDGIFGEALNSLDQTGDVSLPLQRLLDEIQDAGNEFGQTAVGGRAVKRVRAAVNRNRLLTDATEDWLEKLIRQPITNVFIGHLPQNARNLVVGAAVRMLQALRRRNRIPPFLLVLDEAHFLLPGGGEHTPSTSVLREMIRTARHDAVGVVLSTQSPSSMDRQALLTCNTRVVFALDRDDLKVVAGTLGDLPNEIVERIPKLPKGAAIISSGMDLMRHPALITIRKRRTREGSPTPNMAEEVRRWRKQTK